MNSRSLRLDAECDTTIDAREVNSGDRVTRTQAIRDRLIDEHLGVASSNVAKTIEQTGPIIATFDRSGGNRTRHYTTPNLSNVEKWPADNEVFDPEG